MLGALTCCHLPVSAADQLLSDIARFQDDTGKQMPMGECAKKGSMFGTWPVRFVRMEQHPADTDVSLMVYNTGNGPRDFSPRDTSLASLRGAKVTRDDPTDSTKNGPYGLNIYRADYKPVQIAEYRFGSREERERFFVACENVSEGRPFYMSRRGADEIKTLKA